MFRRGSIWVLGVGFTLLIGFLGGLWFAGMRPSQTAVQPAPLEVPSAPITTSPTSETTTPSMPVNPVPTTVPAPPLPAPPVATTQAAPLPPTPDLQVQQSQAQAAPQPASPQVQVPPHPATSEPLPSVPGAQTLAPLNAVRALARVPAVTRNAKWEADCVAHARYLVLADTGEHSEDPSSPYRSAAGEKCAPGHYFVSSQAASGAERAVNYWATGAFHLPQLINPRLQQAAFAVAHDTHGSVQSAAVLDVRRGQNARALYPVRFPAPDTLSPYTTAASFEWPDPLPGCPGYQHPIGAPIAVLLGYGSRVIAAAIKVNGQAVAACLLTAETFHGQSENETRVGRNVLAAQGVAVLLPRHPLAPGQTVNVSFQTPSGPLAWAFKVR